MKWFKSLKNLFMNERPRTLIRIDGNKLNCLHLDSRGRPGKRYKVKFKNSTKLKKFWERYVLNSTVQYAPKEKLYWTTRLLTIRR